MHEWFPRVLLKKQPREQMLQFFFFSAEMQQRQWCESMPHYFNNFLSFTYLLPYLLNKKKQQETKKVAKNGRGFVSGKTASDLWFYFHLANLWAFYYININFTAPLEHTVSESF